MKNILFTLQTVLLLLCLIVGRVAWAEDANDPYYGEEAQQYTDQQSSDPQYGPQPSGDALFSMAELEDMVAPIALYPDPLIAQVLPAATFVDQIDEAARYVSQYGRYARIDGQYWDVSVKAVAHYPDVLNMMDQQYDWTVSLGQAFINQPDDIMYAIQLLRQDARAAGNLVSTPQQQVIIDNGYIRIIPAQPQVIYVPVYDPKVVYVERPSPGFGFITFSAGLSIGVWLNRDCDWRDRRVFYHGWRGRDWIDRARPHVQIQNNIYINKTNTVININRNVMRHDTERYRARIRQDVRVRRERHELPPSMRRDQPPRERVPKPDRRPAPGTAVTPRPGGSRPGQHLPEKPQPPAGKPAPAVPPQQPHASYPGRDQKSHGRDSNRGERQAQPPEAQPRPGIPAGIQQPRTVFERSEKQRPPATLPKPPMQPAPSDMYRGRDIQGAQPASRSGYGGYGTNRDATIYRERGKTSQDIMKQTVRPAPALQRPSVQQQTPPRKVVPFQQQPVQRPAPAFQRPSIVPRSAPAARPAAPPMPRPAAQPVPKQAAPPAPRKAPAPNRDEKKIP